MGTQEDRVEFGLLGPLVVGAGESRVPVSAGKQRVLLAALLLRANQVVSAAELAEAVWEGRPPETARVTLQNYVKRLRQALGPVGYERIVTRPAGYLIEVGPGELDVTRFGELEQAGRAAAQAAAWPDAVAQLNAALALWRGEPLADVPSHVLAQAEMPRLAEMRLGTLETRIDADLHLGRHHEVIAELQALTAAEPLRERLHELLMLALYRSGQRDTALAAYRYIRRHLVDEIGIEPGPGLRELNQRIRRSDPGLLLRPPPAGPAAAGGRDQRARPMTLPTAVPGFTGRERELEVLSGMARRPGGPVLITAIGGTAGVGKTALAVQWARRAAAEFPDGQLYVNLRGFGPAEPLPPAEALRGFLDALQVPATQIPADLNGQQALYRTLLDRRRVLILLDNARDPEQVRPLLPVSPTSVVLVTSRDELAGLIAADGARPITLDVLSDAEAYRLMAERIGAARLAAEPAAARELIALCARLPLALAITAARAVAHPCFTLAALAAELRDAHGRLDALSTGEDATDVRAVLSWSYRQLSPRPARMFRLLGLHPGPDITASAAASLAGLDPPEAADQLRELAHRHLLAEPAPGRYAFHDLLHAYAAEQAATTDSQADRDTAVHRMLDHYLHTAHAAAVLIKPGRQPLDLGPAEAGTAPEVLGGDERAMDWLAAERRVLLAAVAIAFNSGFDTCAWQLAHVICDFLERRGRWDECKMIQQTAVAAAARIGDAAGQAASLRYLAAAEVLLGDYDQARTHLTDCIRLNQQLGDRVGEAYAYHDLGALDDSQGRHAAALGCYEHALALHSAAGHRVGRGLVMNAIGWTHAMRGDYLSARTSCRRALVLLREAGHRYAEAHTLDSLGYVEHHLGHLPEAVKRYQQSIGLFRQLGARLSEAETLARLGDTRRAAGHTDAARDAWSRALEILDDLSHPGAEEVRAKLRELGPAGRPNLRPVGPARRAELARTRPA
jgi:DNA-binding SARP family transcriptional activator/Tfp pilus assembly protein PilF